MKESPSATILRTFAGFANTNSSSLQPDELVLLGVVSHQCLPIRVTFGSNLQPRSRSNVIARPRCVKRAHRRRPNSPDSKATTTDTRTMTQRIRRRFDPERPGHVVRSFVSAASCVRSVSCIPDPPLTAIAVMSLLRHLPDGPCPNEQRPILRIQPPRFKRSHSDPARVATILAFRWLVSLVREHGIDGSGHFQTYFNCRLPSP